MKTVTIKTMLFALTVSLSSLMTLSAHAKPAHDVNHKNHADCVRTDGLNSSGPVVKRSTYGAKVNHAVAPKQTFTKVTPSFKKQAQSVMNMSKVKRVSKIHNPNHANHADCVRTDGLNNHGAAVRVVSRK